MTAQLAVFFVLAALAAIGAVSLILQKHPIHSALSLIVVMGALAGLYLLLEAEFIAAIEIIVYAGAIMVLFVFVIMLLNAGSEERTNLSRTALYAGVPLAMFLLVELAYRVARASAPMAAQPTPGISRSIKARHVPVPLTTPSIPDSNSRHRHVRWPRVAVRGRRRASGLAAGSPRQ